jgi:hypothetical protein
MRHPWGAGHQVVMAPRKASRRSGPAAASGSGALHPDVAGVVPFTSGTSCAGGDRGAHITVVVEGEGEQELVGPPVGGGEHRLHGRELQLLGPRPGPPRLERGRLGRRVRLGSRRLHLRDLVDRDPGGGREREVRPRREPHERRDGQRVPDGAQHLGGLVAHVGVLVAQGGAQEHREVGRRVTIEQGEGEGPGGGVRLAGGVEALDDGEQEISPDLGDLLRRADHVVRPRPAWPLGRAQHAGDMGSGPCGAAGPWPAAASAAPIWSRACASPRACARGGAGARAPRWRLTCTSPSRARRLPRRRATPATAAVVLHGQLLEDALGPGEVLLLDEDAPPHVPEARVVGRLAEQQIERLEGVVGPLRLELGLHDLEACAVEPGCVDGRLQVPDVRQPSSSSSMPRARAPDVAVGWRPA